MSERQSELARFALHLIANSIREERENQRCTCAEYWHYPLDHNTGCLVGESALRLISSTENEKTDNLHEAS